MIVVGMFLFHQFFAERGFLLRLCFQFFRPVERLVDFCLKRQEFIFKLFQPGVSVIDLSADSGSNPELLRCQIDLVQCFFIFLRIGGVGIESAILQSLCRKTVVVPDEQRREDQHEKNQDEPVKQQYPMLFHGTPRQRLRSRYDRSQFDRRMEKCLFFRLPFLINDGSRLEKFLP